MPVPSNPQTQQIARLLALALPDGYTAHGERSLPTLLLGVKALLSLYESQATLTIPRLPSLLHALLGPDATAPLLLQWGDCAALLRKEEARARIDRATAAPRLEVCGGQPSALGSLHMAGTYVHFLCRMLDLFWFVECAYICRHPFGFSSLSHTYTNRPQDPPPPSSAASAAASPRPQHPTPSPTDATTSKPRWG